MGMCLVLHMGSCLFCDADWWLTWDWHFINLLLAVFLKHFLALYRLSTRNARSTFALLLGMMDIFLHFGRTPCIYFSWLPNCRYWILLSASFFFPTAFCVETCCKGRIVLGPWIGWGSYSFLVPLPDTPPSLLEWDVDGWCWWNSGGNLITDPPAPPPFFIHFLFLFIFQIRQFQGKQAIIFFFFSIFFINGKPLKN